MLHHCSAYVLLVAGMTKDIVLLDSAVFSVPEPHRNDIDSPRFGGQ